jgi:magnesium-transporting ATPase (P-type)
MYGFLILLPLTLISLLIGSLIAASTQVADYVAYITDISRQDGPTQQIWADRRIWMQIASHVAGYAVLCFALIATVRTISAPLPPDRPAGLRFFQLM